MYVRWQRQTRKKCSRMHDHVVPVFLAAILVESHRVDGKPRQRHIAYLGGIQDVQLASAGHRRTFWRHAQEHLDGLALANAQRRRIEDALARVVARPTEEESGLSEHEFARLEAVVAGRR